MSWLSKKTGRPKEEGGHQRVNVSLSHRVAKILDVSDNRSKYVERCVKVCTEIKWIAFNESSVTVNDNYCVPKTAATFFWCPSDRRHNAIVSTFLTFQYQCTGKSLRFRMKVNESVTPFFEAPGSLTWYPFEVYTNPSFADGIDADCNQNGYIIELQFEPLKPSDRALIKDIYAFFEVIDGLPVVEH